MKECVITTTVIKRFSEILSPADSVPVHRLFNRTLIKKGRVEFAYLKWKGWKYWTVFCETGCQFFTPSVFHLMPLLPCTTTQLKSVVLKNAFHVPRYVASSNILRNVTKLVPFVNLWNVTQRNDKFWPKFSFQYVTNSYRIFKEFLSIHTWMFNICVTVEKFCVKGWWLDIKKSSSEVELCSKPLYYWTLFTVNQYAHTETHKLF